ncbi:sensor protein ZraS [Geobacter sp. OR-1]|uniref:cache domain-containing protein n=1 Tax=Geobacter sp. OR-1 TaxID=1266765 RepID=UPI000543E33B|nr:cache domain-containing protein [Geobacter sp. OR-1]GAM08105.1 sensor protein ZraS [Geobacter sp. OR-1]
MHRYLFKFMDNLKLRWKMLIVVMPQVVIPIFVVGSLVGLIASRQAYQGITKTSKDDLQHMASFSTDLLNAHHQQFQVYKKDKQRTINLELATLANLSYNLVESQNDQARKGSIDLATAKEEARKALKKVNVGATGYIYAMNTKGDLMVHIAREGENVFNEKDENGRYFIREICESAKKSKPGEILYITYPWRNATIGDQHPRIKVVAYRYFREWDWIIAAGSYADETYEDAAFEKSAFEELRSRLKSKKVGDTGYIFCMNRKGTLTIHPDSEGLNIYDARDLSGSYFIREMCTKKSGWIRYPWKNKGDKAPRMKIVRYEYFEPWDWIVAVGSYEDEFYRDANKIKGTILGALIPLVLVMGGLAAGMVTLAAKVLTDPINHMIEVIRKVKRGRLDERMAVESGDELGELASAFNRMTEMIRNNKEMEATLAQQGKMASLGVLSSGVAHEINNPLGVILGYASYLEGKMPPEDPGYKYIHEIKRESKRCKKIVQDLLSYARTPKPDMEMTDINGLLEQIVTFAANHTDMHHVTVAKELGEGIPEIEVDGDQLRQVAINLILNAGAAMPKGGQLVVSTHLSDDGFVEIAFADTGAGIAAEYLEKIFEPFFTTKEKGTGLGLAITKQIIEMHHGTVKIRSAVGEGTTVTIRLPVEQERFL